MKTAFIPAPVAASLVLSLATGELASTTTKSTAELNTTSASSSRATTLESTEGAVCGAWTSGLDLPGYDLRSVQSSEYYDCRSYCYRDDNCKAWTWTDFNGGTCWLKSGHGNAVLRAGAVSGENFECSDGTPRYLVVENCDARGNDGNSRSGASYWDCLRADAEAFTWSDYGGGTCWYKSVASGCEYAPNKFTGVRLH